MRLRRPHRRLPLPPSPPTPEVRRGRPVHRLRPGLPRVDLPERPGTARPRRHTPLPRHRRPPADPRRPAAVSRRPARRGLRDPHPPLPHPRAHRGRGRLRLHGPHAPPERLAGHRRRRHPHAVPHRPVPGPPRPGLHLLRLHRRLRVLLPQRAHHGDDPGLLGPGDPRARPPPQHHGRRRHRPGLRGRRRDCRQPVVHGPGCAQRPHRRLPPGCRLREPGPVGRRH